jgi:hypothetical protein
MDESKKVMRTAVIILFVLIVAVAAYYFFFSGRPSVQGPTEPPLATKKPPGEEIGGKEAMDAESLAVELDKSDDPVRSLAAELSSNPTLGQWLKTKDLIRKFVAGVDNVANGQSPRPQWDFFTPRGEFMTSPKDGQILLDPAGFDRYNIVADVFDSVSTQGCARLYQSLRPLLQKAYRDLGYPKEDFHQTLYRAIVEILRTPVVDAPIILEKKVTTYVMADARLEDLSAAQKHLLRMGPENVQLIQAKLREIALALGFTEDQLPKQRIYVPR